MPYLDLLGGVYLRTGKYAEGQAQARGGAGGGRGRAEPPRCGGPLNNLALSFERQARYDDAIAALRQALGVD